MPFTIEKLPHEPIVIVKVTPPFSFATDTRRSVRAVADEIRGLPGPIYRISDVSEVTIGFMDLVHALAVMSREEEGGAPDHRLRFIFVGDLEILEMARESARQDQYGNVEIHIFAALDEALDFARRQRSA
ncbi:MAG: hypothetical protein GYB68_08240 [Chloroflexi bacterium]|nr:hypothetical protein [Chloroflexota bacterium]